MFLCDENSAVWGRTRSFLFLFGINIAHYGGRTRSFFCFFGINVVQYGGRTRSFLCFFGINMVQYGVEHVLSHASLG